MTRYLGHSDVSFNDSLQEPLKELDLNESANSFVQLDTQKPSLRNDPSRYIGSRNRTLNSRNIQNKENRGTDADKLPVYHQGPHGEQLGTLIVRHHVQKDSKCIQCRNCGIFFTTASFLKHCHDQYGKRAQSTAIQLQLGLDCPTSQQKEAWNDFQKKLLSDKNEIANPDSRAAAHIQNLERRPAKMNFRLETKPDKDQYRARRSSVDIPTRRTHHSYAKSGDVSSTPADDTLFRSKKFPSTTALQTPQPDTLTLSELRPEIRNTRMSASQEHNDRSFTAAKHVPYIGRTSAYETRAPDRTEPWSRAAIDRKPLMTTTNHLPVRLEPPQPTYGLEKPFNTRPWDVPDATSDDSFSLLKPNQELVFSASKPLSAHDQFATLQKTSTGVCSTEDGIEDKSAKDLLAKAVSLLTAAADKITKDSGQNSNAWRKMYEEERDHRMQLEAKIRDLERELRSKKT